jgi:hypothetical protein
MVFTVELGIQNKVPTLTQARGDWLLGWEAHNLGHVDRKQGADHPAQVILGHECGLCTIWKLCW